MYLMYQPVSMWQVRKLVSIKFVPQNGNKLSKSNGKIISHFSFYHDRRNGFWISSQLINGSGILIHTPTFYLLDFWAIDYVARQCGGLQCHLGQKVTLSEKDSLEITRKALVNSLEKIEGFPPNSSPVWYTLLATVIALFYFLKIQLLKAFFCKK